MQACRKDTTNQPNDVEPEKGFTPLLFATNDGRIALARILLEHGADPNLRNFDGVTPLHRAVYQNEIEIVKMLLEYGADPGIQDRLGNTARDLANRSNDRRMQCLFAPVQETNKQSDGGKMESVPRRVSSYQFAQGKDKQRSQEVSVRLKRYRVTYRKREPQRGLLRLCEKRILEEWAYLDDLPKELANTVANIYYNHCELTTTMTDYKNGSINQAEMLRYLGIHNAEQDLGLTAHEVMAHYIAYVQSNLKTIDEMINNLRQIDQNEDEQTYSLAVDFAILTMKHDIDPKMLMQKNEEAIRRQFQENPVDEIPNLVDLLEL